MKEYYEALWQRLESPLVPSGFDRRAAFLLDGIDPGTAVLDLGCGDGAFCELICEHHPDVNLTGADVAEGALHRARARPRVRDDVSWVQVPFDGPLPLPDNAFALIWAGEVIEHVADTAQWLSEVRRVLAPGGELRLSTPNHTRLALAIGGVGAYSPPLGDHLHLYDARSLRGLLTDFGFAPVEVRAAGRLGPLSGQLLARARR
ncbi:bifunctional 2-polyprenyl-6-hydroxyphenol methylase/3-demethylubiquinol 3-O-methyltransferase UbiG [Conexibacter sp. DBS9H8]|uniref:class I SAM-dependent methyltransferase n=1 Tax=Conexibacter sp. DBS9H8 TaxID=2937801 RepID=UPI00200EBA34|nr:class I SAM-dependent methyltransferase [Conexibacter sp. DBS9H8]